VRRIRAKLRGLRLFYRRRLQCNLLRTSLILEPDGKTYAVRNRLVDARHVRHWSLRRLGGQRLHEEHKSGQTNFYGLSNGSSEFSSHFFFCARAFATSARCSSIACTASFRIFTHSLQFSKPRQSSSSGRVSAGNFS